MNNVIYYVEKYINEIVVKEGIFELNKAVHYIKSNSENISWESVDYEDIEDFLIDGPIYCDNNELECITDVIKVLQKEKGYDNAKRENKKNKVSTPEELIALGLSKLSNRKHVTELGDRTIAKLKNNQRVKEPEYVWNSVAEETNFEQDIVGVDFERCKGLLELKGALLITGVPGTGKTRIMTSLIDALCDGDDSRYKIVSFHQNTDYSDFIRGLRNVDGGWDYVDGVLTQMCKKADADTGNTYYLGIDELSRGNTEAILGEVMTCLESRGKQITLADGTKLVVPGNLHLVGTMNISDNSTKKLDKATKERFTVMNVEPQWNDDYALYIVEKYENYEIVSLLDTICKEMNNINQVIKRKLGADKMIGMRGISGLNNMSVDILKENVRTQLVPIIEEIAYKIDNNGRDLDDSLRLIRKVTEYNG